VGTVTTGATGAMRADVLFIVSIIAFTNCARKVGLINRVRALVGATCGGTITCLWWYDLSSCNTQACLKMVSSWSPNDFFCLDQIDVDGTWELVSTKGSFPWTSSESITWTLLHTKVESVLAPCLGQTILYQFNIIIFYNKSWTQVKALIPIITIPKFGYNLFFVSLW